MPDEPTSGLNVGVDYGGREAGRIATRRVWVLAVAAGALAGLAAWGVGEEVQRAYRPMLTPMMKPVPTLEDSLKITRARVSSGIAAVTAAGALVGLALGAAGGAARRSVGSTIKAGVVGVLAGGLAAAGVASVLMPLLYAKLDPQSTDLAVPLLGHIALWSTAGFAGGLAFGIGTGRKGVWLRTAVGGLVGAALATVVYELAGALLFPTHRTHLPVAGSPETRAMAQVLVGLGAAIGAIVAADEAKKKPPAQV
ncbi:MAG: hypothetical protein P4L85_12430 [Paludisphaera borealis]|uniref:hypothetical protein n=1 Tax=Paludisphaera borealis TaxID=1387353 RepID=UPI00283F4B0E|nr:hypothetical protein [Paludisphaera borealis]MDR3620151.1 hypothetical protein [Paludisphaera borealis]